jgi:4-hydroxy 2-oxovalerate aldolase
MELTLLDCTLRDGGYYNNWDFEPELVAKYLESIAQTGIQVVELGFRSFPRAGFHGPYAYSGEPFLNELEISPSLRIAVMVDAKTLLGNSKGADAAVGQLFTESKNSKVSLVRVAAHFSQIPACGPIVEALKKRGYSVGLNMMQAGGRSRSDIESAARTIAQWGAVDVLYFADSMGNMDAGDIRGVVTAIRSAWQGDVGFHAHNNMGKANANCIEAIRSGVTWIDSTVTGMGRGAGNAQTEILLNDLVHENLGEFQAEPLYELALAHFAPLQKKMGWGANFAYHYSAIHGIHPSYAQELLSDQRYSSSDVVSALKFLSQSDSASFDSDLVQKAFDENDDYEIAGTWNAENWCKGEEILIIGAGPSTRKYAAAIEQFIALRNIKGLSLNFHKEFAPETLFGYAAVDARRLALDVKRYDPINKPMFLPTRIIPPDLAGALNQLDVRDYDVKVVPGRFRVHATGCEIPRRLTVAYAIALCVIGGASRVYLVGFDGYSANDFRQSEMVESLDVIKGSVDPDFLISLTPTTYPLMQGSIFAPY